LRSPVAEAGRERKPDEVPSDGNFRYGKVADPRKERTMILLNPRRLTRPYPDARSGEVMQKTVDFFETKGKTRLKADYHARAWYADFLDFVRR